MATQVNHADILPGDLIDGGEVGIPRYLRVRHLREVRGIDRVRKHLAVDRGPRYARRAIAQLNGRIRRLAREASKHGCHILIMCGGLSGRPAAYHWDFHEICLSLWICHGHRVVRDILMWDRGWAPAEEKRQLLHGWTGRSDADWRRMFPEETLRMAA